MENDGHLYEDELLGISWIENSFNTLGVFFSLNHDETKSVNIQEKISTIKSILNTWKARNLSLNGKITILKSLVLPHIQILASFLQVDKKDIENLDTIMFDFLWTKGQPLIAKNTIIQTTHLGGLKMLSAWEVFKTAKIMWIKRFTNSVKAKWKSISHFLLGI